MSSERLRGDNRRAGGEEPAWKAERRRDLVRKRKLGEVAIGIAATAVVVAALSHGVKTSEIMNDEERMKNVKKIEVESIVFYDGVNARKEPVVDNLEPNQLASIGEEGGSVTIDYDGEAYYYENENDPNGGWYGFEVAQLSDELLEGGYISRVDSNKLLSDEKYGDGKAWFTAECLLVVEPDEVGVETAWDN